MSADGGPSDLNTHVLVRRASTQTPRWARGSTASVSLDENGEVLLTLNGTPPLPPHRIPRLTARDRGIFVSSGPLSMLNSNFGASNFAVYQTAAPVAVLYSRVPYVHVEFMLPFNADAMRPFDLLASRKTFRVRSQGGYLCFRTAAHTQRQVASAETIVERLGWFLGLASGKIVGSRRTLLTSARDKPVRETIRQLTRSPENPAPLVHLEGAYSEKIQPFLSHFASKQLTSFQRRLIHGRIIASSTATLEVRALLLAGMLEQLRHHFATTVLLPEGRAVRRGDFFLNPTTQRNWSFDELLREFAATNGITRYQSPGFRDFRNAIVHEFRIEGRSFPARFKQILDVQNFVESTILAMFDWDSVPHAQYRDCRRARSRSTSRATQPVRFRR